jgi:hypothetical protein
MTRLAATLSLIVACASSALADEVLLRNGHKLVGIQREEKDRIIIETGYGTVSLPREEVVSVTKGETPLHAYPVLFAEIEKSQDAADFTKLAAWASENKMPRYVGDLMRRALAHDPENAEARAALGFKRHQGRWATDAEMRKEQGQVQEGGRWVLPLEKELAEQRRLESESRRLERESVRKEREDARRRAREEARMQAEIKAASEAPIMGDSHHGLWRPYGYGYGYGHGYGYGYGYWDQGLYDLMSVDYLLRFSAAYGASQAGPFGHTKAPGIPGVGRGASIPGFGP